MAIITAGVSLFPQTHTEWWLNKISKNKMNDNKTIEKLKESGWRVIVVWECELKRQFADQSLDRIIKILI